MQTKPENLDFKSSIAMLLKSFIDEKRRLGCKYTGIIVYLKSFDRFLIGKECEGGLSKEIILEWVKPQPHQKPTTIEHHIHIMQNPPERQIQHEHRQHCVRRREQIPHSVYFYVHGDIKYHLCIR